MSLIRVRFTTGVNCSADGCKINVGSVQLQSNSKYFLVDGLTKVTYNTEEPQTLTSPYSSSGWTDYVDNWTYNKDITLMTTPSTVFLEVGVYESNTTNSSIESVVCKVIKFNNESITKSSNANSLFFVIGDNFIIDGSSQNNIARFLVNETKDVTISSSNNATAIYIEKI